MYGLETEVITLHTCRRRSRVLSAGASSRTHQTASISAPRQGALFSLEAQGLLLVPRPWSRITGPSLLLFNMFTMAALKPHCSSVFALLFICFPSVTIGTKCFLVRWKCWWYVVSLVCAWTEKSKQEIKKDMKLFDVCKCYAGGGGLVTTTQLWFLNLHSEISVQHCFLVPPLANRQASCLCIDVWGLPGGRPINKMYVTMKNHKGTTSL